VELFLHSPIPLNTSTRYDDYNITVTSAYIPSAVPDAMITGSHTPLILTLLAKGR